MIGYLFSAATMDPLNFVKYEGAGNDFLVVEATTESAVSPDRAALLCDRHFGVGADGVLLVVPACEARARAKMVVLNADGSRPEMCGNGLRCVALHLARRDGLEQVDYVIETDAGDRPTKVERKEGFGDVTLGMGRGRVGGIRRFGVKGELREFILVDMGNPHAVAFGFALTEAELDQVGPAFSASQPGGANVEIVQQTPEGLDVLVWERGVGRTLACGTGAAGVAVAAATKGITPFGEPVSVRLPGGTLMLTVEAETLAVTLRGPARLVFSGQVGV
jgi:diaminopimelate epimerase